MIYFGTSGFSYKDWVGPYYPQGMPSRDWLEFYARDFRVTELNFSYYRVPTKSTLERLAAKTPDYFLFTLKAHQDMTHEREGDAGVFTEFVESLEPLIDTGKFGCILAQFPWSFRPGEESFDYLRMLRERLDTLPVVVEFRNRDWISDSTFDFLRENKLGFCCVDQPRLKGLIPPVAEATSSIGYVRFHGRNAKKWWQHEEAWERYDYSYSDEELEEWVPKLRKLDEATDNTFVFANNHWQGQAVQTARQLRMLLPDLEPRR
jgi:uncharacterized protein YecE (DUF72 family)